MQEKIITRISVSIWNEGKGGRPEGSFPESILTITLINENRIVGFKKFGNGNLKIQNFISQLYQILPPFKNIRPKQQEEI